MMCMGNSGSSRSKSGSKEESSRSVVIDQGKALPSQQWHMAKKHKLLLIHHRMVLHHGLHRVKQGQQQREGQPRQGHNRRLKTG